MSGKEADAGGRNATGQPGDACLDRLLALVMGYGLPRADAEDLFQAVALKLCRRLRDGRGTAVPVAQHLAWLTKVVATTAADLLRWKSRHPACSLAEVLGTRQEPATRDENQDDRLDRLDWGEHVRAVLEGLRGRVDDLNLSILNMRLVEELDTAEVARRLGLTRKQVADRLWRVRKKLTDALRNPPAPPPKHMNSIWEPELILPFFPDCRQIGGLLRRLFS